jgi:hypothetical protein
MEIIYFNMGAYIAFGNHTYIGALLSTIVSSIMYDYTSFAVLTFFAVD